MSRTECVICGDDSDVRTGIVEWLEPQDGEVWTSLPRCHDRQACRERCESLGEPYPIRDGTKPAVVAPAPRPAPAEASTWFD